MKGKVTGGHPFAKTFPEHLCLLFRRTMTNDIIGVPFKPYFRPLFLHPNVKRIMQEQISQQRADYPTLWRPAQPLLTTAIRMDHGCLEPSLYVEPMPLTVRMLVYSFHEQFMIYRIKETFDIQIKNPRALPAILACDTNRIQG
jgi:hypothetical protein